MACAVNHSDHPALMAMKIIQTKVFSALKLKHVPPDVCDVF